jgi:SNF2 family DNA or RNA helicase
MERDDRVSLDFTADPEIVRLVVRAEHLTHGFYFNPAFASEISLIDPLPHQRIAVYEHMLPQPRLHMLLADDAGAGKTIMSGLYIQAMLLRRLIRRVLIVPPAGLVDNWRKELLALFNLHFEIIPGSAAKAANPFVGPDSNLAIVSIDTLRGDRMFARLQEPGVIPYDLVIFDEAHKLSANRLPDMTFYRTGRYKLAEAIAGVMDTEPRWTLPWSANHLLLLTATPHMGKDYPYYCLWRLLEPEIFSTYEAFEQYPKDLKKRYFIRRTKEEMINFEEKRIFPMRASSTFKYDLSTGVVSEQTLYERVTDYIQNNYNRAQVLNRSAARLAMSIFQRRLASSTYAILRSLERRGSKLQGYLDQYRSQRIDDQRFIEIQEELNQVSDPLDTMTADEEESDDGSEQNERKEKQLEGATIATTIKELEIELKQVQDLIQLAREVYEIGEDKKFEKLYEVIMDPQYKNEKILVFTEHRDTQEFIVRRLEGLGFTGKVALIHGGMNYEERGDQVEFFRLPEKDGGAQYLIATDAAGEGINLQFCWFMVNYDIPWNPARLEQRMGRVHRYKQKHDVQVANLVAGNTREGHVLDVLLEKLENIRKNLGSDKVFDVIGKLFEGMSLKDYMNRVLVEKETDNVNNDIAARVTEKNVEAIVQKEREMFGRDEV